MIKLPMSLLSLVIFLISVPLVLLAMWIVDSLFGTPQNDSLIVQIFAVTCVGFSFLGTTTGFVIAVIAAWSEGYQRVAGTSNAFRVPFAPLAGIVLNGISSVIWLILIIIMIASARG